MTEAASLIGFQGQSTPSIELLHSIPFAAAPLPRIRRAPSFLLGDARLDGVVTGLKR